MYFLMLGDFTYTGSFIHYKIDTWHFTGLEQILKHDQYITFFVQNYPTDKVIVSIEYRLYFHFVQLTNFGTMQTSVSNFTH